MFQNEISQADMDHTPFTPSVNEKDLAEDSQTILDRCRQRASQRARNRVALIQPRKGTRPAFGFLYLGAYLLDSGFDVKLFEFLDERFPPNKRYNKRLLKDLKKYKRFHSPQILVGNYHSYLYISCWPFPVFVNGNIQGYKILLYFDLVPRDLASNPRSYNVSKMFFVVLQVMPFLVAKLFIEWYTSKSIDS